ncbi:MAG: hypothetical protein E7290_11210 [Lachnospiraceae bacterium]|nr:hypothetical protein [Lachnospiraceae bacterium]
MEKEKNIFDYLGQVLMIFGATMIILHIFSLLFGESAKEISKLFMLGNEGLSTATALQFLLVSVLVVIYRFIFFTDKVIKNMSVAVRTGLMYGVIICTIVIMNVIFGWFPADMWEAWLGFIISFGVCSAVSTCTVLIKDKMENDKMQDALERLKQER